MQNINKILENYNFTSSKDKELLEDFLLKLEKKLEKDDLDEFYDIIEICLNKNKEFDTRILYNPVELVDAILENDLLGKKIDSDEIENIVEKLSFFKKYYNKK